jgi:hypothetical protein
MEEQAALLPALLVRLVIGTLLSVLVNLSVRGIISLQGRIAAIIDGAGPDGNQREPCPGDRKEA